MKQQNWEKTFLHNEKLEKAFNLWVLDMEIRNKVGQKPDWFGLATCLQFAFEEQDFKNDTLDTLIRDITKVGSMSKSEARKRLQSILEEQKNEFNKLITEEIRIAQDEGKPTSRLTSLFNKLNK